MLTDNSLVIVALDGSKNAENAIPVAVFLANAYSSQLHLVHIVTEEERPRADNPAEAAQIFEQYAREQMANYNVHQGYLAIAHPGEAAPAVTRIAEDSSARSSSSRPTGTADSGKP